MERAFIYGDSLLKATMPDADMRYHFHLPEVMAQYPSDRLEVVNRAKMGDQGPGVGGARCAAGHGCPLGAGGLWRQ